MLRKRARGTGLTSLGVESLLIEELNILRTLEAAGAEPLQVVPVNSPLLQPVDIFQTRDYGRYFMVRAANMKLTIDKGSLTVVNISAGGTRINRLAGHYARPTPATQVMDIIEQIPAALAQVLDEKAIMSGHRHV
ncbi:MAG: hypothetical protein H8E19_06455 [Deltaproteobacteria bacterium]|uniref:DUF8182 domain-containing protein n=1 Tax=Candidatus Desulfacyla euxinica TaxID=2841693 RepID=A0A8J6MZN0_9DELT|nr:hypothetical protein [Candidatus Desulfacyla euxinica]